MLRRTIIIALGLAWPTAAVPQTAPAACQPAPVIFAASGLPARSTYVSDGEPPKRFAKAPNGYVKVRFGQQAIDEVCGRPPCGKVFLGCTRGDLIVLPDPFSSPDFARIARHELGHFAGWPASHGE
jgi:hypothetical protein